MLDMILRAWRTVKMGDGINSKEYLMGCGYGVGELGGGCRATGLRKLHPLCRTATL